MSSVFTVFSLTFRRTRTRACPVTPLPRGTAQHPGLGGRFAFEIGSQWPGEAERSFQREERAVG